MKPNNFSDILNSLKHDLLKKAIHFTLVASLLIIQGCTGKKDKNSMENFAYQTEQFADIRILRYNIPGFEKLSLQQKKLAYYLYEAGLAGRDIIWDQNYRYNLIIRKTLEEIILHFNGNRNTAQFQEFITYTKRVFVANGIHHHNSSLKIIPGFSKEYLAELIQNSPESNFPVKSPEEIDQLISTLQNVLFDPTIDAIKTNLNPDEDLLMTSAVNYYSGVSQDEASDFYNNLSSGDNKMPVMWGLNSQLVKSGDDIAESIWRTGGMYSKAIEQIVYWLQKALSVAENQLQKQIIGKLTDFYNNGDLSVFDDYNILWVRDTVSVIDFTNGFIETYTDPLGLKGAWQSMVSAIDNESGQRVQLISANAQWFEDNMPYNEAFKKPMVKGISARAINVIAISGENSPTPPLGVNLPNSDWIRREHGSKSVTITNIARAYYEADFSAGIMTEFAFNNDELELAKNFGFLARNLYTDLHEIIGHGSGQLLPGVADMSITLKNYASVIEETRADLAALYFAIDAALVDRGIVPTLDVGKTFYNQYIRNGMMLQLQRVSPGANIQQAHMRNRQLVAKWVYEKGSSENIIERKSINGKTYFVINDHLKLRNLFGELLTEIQRIKSEGDFIAARNLVENYAIKVDQELLAEVHQRFTSLNIPPFSAFINPVLTPVIRNDRIVDVKVEYPSDFLDQMLFYSRNYSTLTPLY